jgi:hypothetical protein
MKSPFRKQKFMYVIDTKFVWIIPYIIGVSRNILGETGSVFSSGVEIPGSVKLYSLHITPFIELSFGRKGTRTGSVE